MESRVGRHLAFVAVNTVAAAASAFVVMNPWSPGAQELPPEHGFWFAVHNIVRLTIVAGSANVLLYPALVAARSWAARIVAVALSFATCLLVYAAWSALVDAGPPARRWYFAVLVFYGTFVGAPFLALDLALIYALRRPLLPDVSPPPDVDARSTPSSR